MNTDTLERANALIDCLKWEIDSCEECANSKQVKQAIRTLSLLSVLLNTENTVDVSDSPGGESAALHADGGSNACTVENSEQESVADQMEVITDDENVIIPCPDCKNDSLGILENGDTTCYNDYCGYYLKKSS